MYPDAVWRRVFPISEDNKNNISPVIAKLMITNNAVSDLVPESVTLLT